MQVSLDELNELDDVDFVKLLKDVFEHSPWVAERSVEKRPFTSIRSLHSTMASVVASASSREQLELIRAHPDLAGKAALAGELTEASTSEQAGAGLDSLTSEEYERFNDMNSRYRSQFGFPFIIAVKGHDKHSILEAFDRRLENSEDEEREEALRQISEIARFRLEAILDHEED